MNRPLITTTLLALTLLPVGAHAQGLSIQALDSLLNAPVSTVSKYEQRQTEAPAFVTIVTREDIERYAYQTLDEVLRNQVGFYSGSDRDHTDIGVRGVGRPGQYNNRLVVLIDGHTLNDNFTGGTRVSSAMPVDLDAIERVEIVRGPGSALYGARAMLAVVNLVTRKGRDLDGVAVSADVGNRGAFGGAAQYGTVFGTDSDLSLSASWSRSNGEELYFPELDFASQNNGIAEDLDWQNELNSLATFRRGGLFLQAGFGNREKGVPTASYGSTFNHPDAKSRDTQAFLEGRMERPLADNVDLTVRGFFDAIENVGVYPFGAPSGLGEQANVQSDVRVRSGGGEARLDWRPSPSQRIVFGAEAVDVFRATFDTNHDATPGGEFPYSILSAFLHQEFQMTEGLALTLGLRRDRYSSEGSATTPRAALVYRNGTDGSTTLKLMAGEAFRPPNLLELRVNAPMTGLFANPDLEPERVRTFEFVWEQRIGPVAGTLSLFQSDVDDLVDIVTIELPDELSEFGQLGFQWQNVAHAHSRGVELEARTAFGPGNRLMAGYTFVHPRGHHGEELVNAPAHQLRLQGWKRVLDNTDLGLSLRADSRRLALYGAYTDPSVVVDLAVTSRLSEHLKLRLSAQNLLDRRYSAPGGFQHVQSAIPQARRRLVTRVSYQW